MPLPPPFGPEDSAADRHLSQMFAQNSAAKAARVEFDLLLHWISLLILSPIRCLSGQCNPVECIVAGMPATTTITNVCERYLVDASTKPDKDGIHMSGPTPLSPLSGQIQKPFCLFRHAH